MPGVHVRQHKEILWLLLDKPPLNPLTVEMLDLLTKALHNALKHPPRLVVISGMGEQAFCVGVEMPGDTEAERARLLLAARETATALEALHAQNIPTVALIKGYAYGAGCELLSYCDTVIAREDATFRLPAINARVFPDAVSLNLPAAIGKETTTRLMQSGETLSARQAMHLGLVHQVLAARRFLADTEELLVMLAAQVSF
ncbi:MAG: enoyl-CoA hydratase/isomerase family protein [Ktedonobacteraceae bacterium]|nr:enoyl-CoA hydratase/isomerase family protein [Ktedonobacteraceae bacterium]